MASDSPNNGFSPEEIKACLHVLETVLADRKTLAQLSQEERKRLLMSAGQVSRPDKLEIMKIAKAHRRNRRKKDIADDRLTRAKTAIRRARLSSVYVAPQRALENSEKKIDEPGDLKFSRSCYVCKADFNRLHHFYDAMCGACGDLNYEKRFQKADLSGRVAVITGARLKIGYQAALLMLRAGAHVVVTTRFPHDAAIRYAKEPDFSQWKDRLQIHGLDLRHSPSVELFTRYLDQTLPRLDFLINNAAQTVRRPPGFYKHMMEIEAKPVSELDESVRPLLRLHEACKAALSHPALPAHAPSNGAWLSAWHGENQSLGIGLRRSAALSQIPYDHSDGQLGEEIFPSGKTDADLQQVDMRAVNSWRLTLADVPTAEMLELQLVNSVAPFILCGKLKPLMLRDRTFDKHVVNVSAMEGKFTRYTKTDKHPHTNMAKAALNMMTLTSAADYAKDGIYMNAVDTGWVTDEDPIALSTRKQAEHDFQPPLDIVDGAARVIDPIFHGLNTGQHMWGKFLKDYGPTTW